MYIININIYLINRYMYFFKFFELYVYNECVVLNVCYILMRLVKNIDFIKYVFDFWRSEEIEE